MWRTSPHYEGGHQQRRTAGCHPCSTHLPFVMSGAPITPVGRVDRTELPAALGPLTAFDVCVRIRLRLSLQFSWAHSGAVVSKTTINGLPWYMDYTGAYDQWQLLFPGAYACHVAGKLGIIGSLRAALRRLDHALQPVSGCACDKWPSSCDVPTPCVAAPGTVGPSDSKYSLYSLGGSSSPVLCKVPAPSPTASPPPSPVATPPVRKAWQIACQLEVGSLHRCLEVMNAEW